MLKLVFTYVAYFLLSFQLCFAELKKLTILHTNDFHGHIKEEATYAGAAKISAYFKLIRQSEKHVLTLDAGDCISGTPVSTIFQGTPIFEVMSAMKYDAAVLGNHEFDHGYRQIEKFKQDATFPLICANAFDPDGKLIADKEVFIKTINGVKIGVIGLLTKETPIHIIKTGNRDLQFKRESDTVKKFVELLEPECDLIIALTHMGSKADQQLARETTGLDLIIGGHDHKVLDTPILENGVFITQAGSYGKYIGHITIQYDTETKHLHSFKSKLVPALQLKRVDREVLTLVNHWEGKVSDLVDRDIAYADRDISGAELRDLLEKAITETYGSDFAYHNAGGIRDKIYKGKITKRHILNILPFNNHVTHLMVKGKDFNQHLKRHLKQPIDLEKVYLISTNNFVTDHYQNFIAERLVGKKDTNHILADVIADYLAKHMPLNQP